MPYAVTHILVPILLVAIFRDFYLRKRERSSFPLHYVLIAGIGGVLPDFDLIISVVLNFLGVNTWYVHKTFLHSIFFPIILFAVFLILKPVHAKARICNLTKHNLKLSTIFLLLSIGAFIHLLLDAIFGGPSYFLYPFLMYDFSINLVRFLPPELKSLALPLLDGILLVVWIVYLEVKHRISDFI